MKDQFIYPEELKTLSKEALVKLISIHQDYSNSIHDEVGIIFTSMTTGQFQKSTLSTLEMLAVISTLMKQH